MSKKIESLTSGPALSHPMVPMNDLKRIAAGELSEYEEAALTVIRSGYWLEGPSSTAFCQAFARYIGLKFCFGVGNGTDALEIALRALASLGRVDSRAPPYEVITVANAGGYTSTACQAAGLVPVYVDIDVSSQLLEVSSLRDALSERTLAVVVTHLYGGIVDVPAVRDLLNSLGRPDVAIVEDCAQAHGANFRGRIAGSMGDVATFSFYPTKNLGALGDAGAIGARDETLAQAIRQLRQYGWSGKYSIGVSGGRNSRLDEIQAALLHTKLPKLNALNARRQAIVKTYADNAPAGVSVVSSPNGGVSHLAVLLTEYRDRFRNHMKEHGIATDIHYPILDCDQAGWKETPHRIAGDLKNSRHSVARIVTLPCFPTMTDEEVSRVGEALRSFRA